MHTERALLIASFGTTVPAAEQDIAAVEAALAAAAPGWTPARAYTSGMVRRALAERGQQVDGVPDALEKLRAAGVREVFVQPTHLLNGAEYQKLHAEALAAAPGFAKLRVGLPLLDGNCTENYLALSAILEKLYPAREGEAVVLMGHGAKGKHKANAAYTSLQVMLELARVRNIWIGTVEGWPTFEEIHSRLGGCRGLRRIRLAPLMLCAGDHALHDMAGDGPDSWKSILAADGYEVECVMQGLGSQPQVQALYAYHLNNQLEGRL